MNSSENRIPAITAMGRAVGNRVITNEQVAEDLGKPPAVIERLMSRVGIETRNWVTPSEQATSDLATEAIRDVVRMRPDFDINSIKAIVTGTSSPDYLGVTVSAIVQHKLELGHNIRVVDVMAACTGWLQALDIVYSSLMNPNGPGGPQVAIGAEVISHTLSSKKPLVYPLFGDAAGATVIELVPPDEGAPTQMGFAFGGNGQYDENLYIPAGGSKKRASHETVDNDEHSLYMDGDIIKQQAIENMALLTKQVLAEQHMDINDVDLFIPHQANLQIMLATAEAIGFPRERVMETIRTYGNTSSASIPTALSEAWDQERIHRNDMLLVATFGAGLTFGAGIIPMVGLPKRK